MKQFYSESTLPITKQPKTTTTFKYHFGKGYKIKP